jgi:L-rhamnose-H+ transport protein
MTNIFWGLLIVIIAAIFQGSFAVPMAYARTWKWENSWIMFSIFGMIILNLIFSIISIPNLFQIYSSSSITELLVPVLFGLLFGIGAITFGLGLTSVGFALGYAVMLGTGLGIGTFIPLVVLHPEEIFTSKGMFVLLGLLVTISGIAISGYAGTRKEREQGKSAGEITRDSRFSMKIGILICILSAICSSAINIGFVFSKPLVNNALASGAPDNWAGNAVWALLFSFGGIVNIIYCLYLMGKNKSSKAFRSEGSFKNFILLFFMSLMWIGSFILYGVGATMMGSWGTVIGWAVYMALSIAMGNFWGIVQGEWKGASNLTKGLMARGVVIIIFAIFILAYSGTL